LMLFDNEDGKFMSVSLNSHLTFTPQYRPRVPPVAQ